jgi:hypothetical protein
MEKKKFAKNYAAAIAEALLQNPLTLPQEMFVREPMPTMSPLQSGGSPNATLISAKPCVRCSELLADHPIK